MKKPDAVSSVIIGAALLLAGFVAFYIWNMGFRPPSRGDVYETRLFEGKNVIIRANAYKEDFHGAFALSGGIHTFEARPRMAAQWTTLFECRHAAPIPIHECHGDFVADDIAFLYMRWVFYLTTDGGRSWSSWCPSKDLPDWSGEAGAHASGIAEVKIAPDGTGTMLLQDEDKDIRALLKTRDWGHTWSAAR